MQTPAKHLKTKTFSKWKKARMFFQYQSHRLISALAICDLGLRSAYRRKHVNNEINDVCAFPTLMSQNVCSEKDILQTLHSTISTTFWLRSVETNKCNFKFQIHKHYKHIKVSGRCPWVCRYVQYILQRNWRRCTWLSSGRVSAVVKVGDKSSSHRDRGGVAEGKVVQTEH